MKKYKYKNGKDLIIYARYSSEKQSEMSIEGQIEDCEEWAEKNGYNIIAVYADRAKTGTETKRENYNRMFADLESGRVSADGLLVYKLDRLNRHQYACLEAQQRLNEMGMRLYRAKEVNAEGATGVLTTGMDMLIAEYFSHELSEKTAKGMRVAANKFQSLGSLPPLGYRYENKQFVIDEEKREVIEIIFNLYADGMPKQELADYLNSHGYTARGGKPFKISTFENMLKCPKYYGAYDFKGEIIGENVIPAIISKELYDRVQNRLKSNQKHSSAQRKRCKEVGKVWMLSGRISCGCCGSPIQSMGGKGNGGRYSYYSCLKRVKTQKCKKAHENKDKLEAQVLDLTLENFGLHTQKGIEGLAQSIKARYKADSQHQRVSSAELELLRLQKEVEKSTLTLIQNPNLKTLAKMIEEQESRIEELKIQIEEEKKQIKKEPTITEVTSWLNKCFGVVDGDYTAMSNKAKQKLIDLLINHIIVEDDKLTIIYNLVPNTPTVPYTEIKENIPTENSVGISKLLAPPTGLEPVTP